MTGLTFRAISTGVVVLAQVAIHTGTCQPVFEILANMTVLAIQATVSVFQGKSCLYEVIEADAFPGFR